jgi:hypothetical protein
MRYMVPLKSNAVWLSRMLRCQRTNGSNSGSAFKSATLLLTIAISSAMASTSQRALKGSQSQGASASGAVYDQVRDRLPFHFVDLGDQTLKNIARAVSIYAVATGEIIEPEQATVGQPNAARQAVDDGFGSLDSGPSAGEHGTRPNLAVAGRCRLLTLNRLRAALIK